MKYIKLIFFWWSYCNYMFTNVLCRNNFKLSIMFFGFCIQIGVHFSSVLRKFRFDWSWIQLQQLSLYPGTSCKEVLSCTDHIEEICFAQEPLLWLSYCFSYFPFVIFGTLILPAANLKKCKRYQLENRWVDVSHWGKVQYTRTQEPLLWLSNFCVIAPFIFCT